MQEFIFMYYVCKIYEDDRKSKKYILLSKAIFYSQLLFALSYFCRPLKKNFDGQSC